ncbi:amidohydrolase family protein, partial [Christensenellaceae bacterium OttesenSCG-928-L17]|nr:amidohydrolase family protein [Christensenellaceae bacterium OttesenSCG-928-L17]
EGAEILDLSNKFVMPGLIDCHVHINLDGNSMLQKFLNENSIGDITIACIQNAQANLFAGFTTIRDEGAAHFTDVAVKQAIENGKIVGPRMFVSGMPITATGGHCDAHMPYHAKGERLGIVCDSPDAVRAAVRLNLKHGADQVKIMATGGVMSFGDDPKYSELSYEEMRMAVETAQARGKITSAHAHGSDGIMLAARAGVTSIEHGTLMDEACIEQMEKAGTYLIPTMIAAKLLSDDQSGLPQWMVEKAKAVASLHRRNVGLCRKAGLHIGFGSDAGTNHNFHGKQTREMNCMKEVGFSPTEILIAATRTNAELMRLHEAIGTLEPGKLADIVAYDKSPLEDLNTMHAVSFVMKDGEVVKREEQSAMMLHGE